MDTNFEDIEKKNQSDVEDLSQKVEDTSIPDGATLNGQPSVPGATNDIMSDTTTTATVDPNVEGIDFKGNIQQLKGIEQEQEKQAVKESTIKGDSAEQAGYVQKDAADEAAANVKQSQDLYANYLTKTKEAYDDLTKAADIHVNPRKFIDNMSTGNKIFASFGMLLAGFGGADAVQKTVGNINTAIQQDIAAQESNRAAKMAGAKERIGAQGDIIKTSMAHFRELGVQQDIETKLRLDAVISDLTVKMNAPGVGKEQSLAAQKVVSELQKQSLTYENKVGEDIGTHVSEVVSTRPSIPGAPVGRMIETRVPKNLQAEVYKELNISEQAKKYMDDISKSFPEMLKTAPFYSQTGMDTKADLRQSTRQYNALKKVTLEDFTKKFAGRVTPTNTALIAQALPVAGDDPKTLNAKMDVIKRTIMGMLKPALLNAYGIPHPFSPNAPQEITQEQKMRQFIRANPTDPRVPAMQSILDAKGVK